MGSESVDNLCQKAKQATGRGHVEEARQLYLQALGLKSNSPDIHYGMATVCFLLSDLDSAAYHFSEVMRLDPMRPGAYINLGAVLNRLGEHKEAIEVLNRGLQIDPNRAEGHYNLGLVYRNSGQLEQAVKSYQEAARLNPKMLDAQYNLANVYLELKKLDEAIALYRQVLQVKPGWEKAQQGLKAAEAAQTALAKGVPVPENVTAASGMAAAMIDPERMLDPNIHGEALKMLYQATIDSENQGRQYLQTVETVIEPAIKMIYSAILRPKSGFDLDDCVDKFEGAINELRKVHRSLKKSVEEVHSAGDKLLRS